MPKVALPAALLLLLLCAPGCKDDKAKQDTPPPPPSAEVAKPGACASGGGELTDAISAPFFPKSIDKYCVDPQGEVKTYGDKGKLSMDQVCTQAFDGECEVYKGFGLTRVVQLRYVDGSGKGGSVEATLSHFKDEAGAYGMYTLRVVTNERDPADPSTPKPLAAVAAGAIGTGRAYVWRGEYLVELQYINENESPDQLAKSSEAILGAVGKAVGEKLPGPTVLPPAAMALPETNRVANAILFLPKDALGWKAVGPAALGFYRDGDKRWRDLVITKDDADQAKDAFKTIRTTLGALPMKELGDEAVHVVVATGEKGSGPKTEWLIARKGSRIVGVGDEEYAVRDAKDPATVRVSKEAALAKVRALLAAPSAAGAPAAAPSASAAPAPSAAPAASSAPAASAKK
jgi:hypothetical protein